MSEDATTPLLVRMPSALHEAVRVEAGRADRSMASVVRLSVLSSSVRERQAPHDDEASRLRRDAMTWLLDELGRLFTEWVGLVAQWLVRSLPDLAEWIVTGGR